MKSNPNSNQVLAWLAGAILAGAFSFSAYAADCKNPRGSVEARACEKAKQGPETLRRFVERTRMIYGLYYWDFAPSEESQLATTQQEPKVAKSK